MLPRLPDTADELKSIALALEADPSKVLHLGKDANEKSGQDASTCPASRSSPLPPMAWCRANSTA